MAAQNTTRRLTVIGEQKGVREVAREVSRLGDSVQAAAAKTENGQRVFDRSAAMMAQSGQKAAAGVKAVASPMEELKRYQTDVTRLTLSQARSFDSLSKSLDPVHRNLQRYVAVQDKVTAGLESGAYSAERAAMLMELAGKKYRQFGADVVPVNDNVRLAGHEMTNLSRQGQDVITMFAMGANPMQIFTSQAAQVYDAISAGPGGLAGGFTRLRGSVSAGLASLAGFATSLPGIAIGLTGAAAAAVYFATRSDSSIKSATEALEDYKSLLEELQAGYKDAADAAEKFFDKARGEGAAVALASIQGTAVEIQASLAREIETLTARTQGFVTSFKDLTPEVLAGQQAIRVLGNQLASGKITAAEFRQEIAEIRIDPNTPGVLVEVADTLLDASINARDLSNALDAVGVAADNASEKTGRLRIPSLQDDYSPFGSPVDMLKRLRPDDFGALVDGLNQQADEMKKVSEDATKEFIKAAEAREAAIYKEVAAVIEHQRRMIDMREGLSFERESLFMPDSEAAIAAKLKPYGLGLDSVEAGYIRQTEALKRYRDMNRQVWAGVGSDILKNGVEPLDAIGNALTNLQGKLIDQALTGVADSIFDSIFGGSNNQLATTPTQATVGLTSANAMWVRSADGAGSAGGAIDRMLAPANQNNPAGGMSVYREAIASIESRGSGGYSALGPVTSSGDRAYGRYQVMGDNIADWTLAALGKKLSAAEFLASPAAQDATFDHRFGGYVDKYGASGASQAWFGGPGSVGKGGRTDQLGTSVSQYAQKFEAELAKLPPIGAETANAGAAFTNGFAQTTGAINAGIGQIADQFVPGFGGVLQQLLDGMSQKSGGGGIGGMLSGIFGGGGGFGSGTVSSGATASILSGSFGGLFADGGFLGAGKWGIAGERGPEPIIGPAQVISNRQMARMQGASGGSSQPVIQQTFVNAPPVKETREESDGRGGRPQTIVFDEAIAGTLNRPGSKSSRAVGSKYGLKERVIR